MSLILVIWVFELLMFRNRGWIEEPLFYPIAGLFLFSFLSIILSAIFADEIHISYLGLFSFFILLTRRFIRFPEKRKMIIWTFISGVVLTSGLDLIGRLATEPFDIYSSLPASENISFMMLIVFGFVLAYYAESSSVKEKIFFGLVSLPMAIVAILSFNKAAILFLIIIVVIVGISKDRTILIPLGLMILAVVIDLFGIKQIIVADDIIAFLFRPFTDIVSNIYFIDNARFFGSTNVPAPYIPAHYFDRNYLLKMIFEFGPLLLLLFFWIIGEKTRMNFIRFKKIKNREIRAYHLGTLLTIIAALLMNFYGSTFDSKTAVLAFWMILGMSEV